MEGALITMVATAVNVTPATFLTNLAETAEVSTNMLIESYMVWRLCSKTVELYASIQVYVKIGTYLITCLLYLRQQPPAECWIRMFMRNGNNWPNWSLK